MIRKVGEILDFIMLVVLLPVILLMWLIVIIYKYFQKPKTIKLEDKK